MNKLKSISFYSIIFFITETMFIHTGLNEILNSSKTGTIYSCVLGSIISLVILFFITKIINYKKELNIFKKIDLVYGKLGKIINLFLVLIFILYFIYLLWSINTYIQNKYLDSTPSFIIILLFLIPVIWCQKEGIRTISKVSGLLFIITFLIILFSVTNLYSGIDLDNFKPLFNTPIITIIKDGFIFSSYFVTPMFMLLVIPDIKIKNTTLFFIISLVNLLLLFIYIIGVFGIDLASLFSYPEYSLMKKINYFDFIQHIENISTFEWLFSIFISTVMSLNFIIEYLKHINKERLKYIVIPINFILSLVLFSNTTIASNIIKKYYLFIYYIPILLVIFSFNIKRNKN